MLGIQWHLSWVNCNSNAPQLIPYVPIHISRILCFSSLLLHPLPSTPPHHPDTPCRQEPLPFHSLLWPAVRTGVAHGLFLCITCSSFPSSFTGPHAFPFCCPLDVTTSQSSLQVTSHLSVFFVSLLIYT